MLHLIIPKSYAEWLHCLQHKCKIEPTTTFALERLAVYTNNQHEETKRFKELYGDKHVANIIAWLQQLAQP